jgi:ABC-type glycerol-3-phosphate transport system substrate-binding protein
MWEPADDLMANLIGQYGQPSAAVEYMGKQNGHWIAVPSVPLTLTLPSVGRIDLFKQHVGLDLTQIYPAGSPPNKELADKWTWDLFLQAAEKCSKAGFPFGMPLGQTTDAVDWVGAVFASHGSVLVDQEGNVTVKSDATKQVLEWFKKKKDRAVPAARRLCLGRCKQQQMADLRQGRADHEPALGLGRREARCAASRRAAVDL